MPTKMTAREILKKLWLSGWSNRHYEGESPSMEMTLENPLKLEIGHNYIVDDNHRGLVFATLDRLSTNKEAALVKLLDRSQKLWVRSCQIVDEVNP